MRVLIEAHHPAHVHFWKYPIRELQGQGHEVLMIARDRDVMRQLLESYDWIDAQIPKRKTKNNRFPLVEMLERQWAVARAIRKFKPDVVGSLMGSYTQSAKLFGVRNLIFTDSEFQRFNHRIAHPFADEIHTPECLDIDFGRKHRRYSGFHELAYLRRNHFDVNESQLPSSLEAQPDEYVLMRLCAWNTFHDIGNSGLDPDTLERVVAAITEKYKLFIQPEGGYLPDHLEKYRLAIPPETYHDVLCHAAFIVTEGFTTASEAMISGVPSVVINAISCDTLRCQSRQFELVEHYQESAPAEEAVMRMLAEPSRKDREKGIRYQDAHCDVTAYVVEQILKS
jgi:hypothetical protein